MHILTFNNPQAVTHDELLDDLELLPQWRRERVMQYRFLIDRVLCAKAFLLLRQGLETYYGMEHVPEFAYGPCGKPFFEDFPHIHFNLSHSRRGVMCVLADEPVGCDIEDIPDTVDREVCDLCFNQEEKDRIFLAPRPTVQFTRLWTVKETVLKLTGEGLNDNLPSLLTPELQGKVEIVTKESLEGGYVYSYGRFSRR